MRKLAPWQAFRPVWPGLALLVGGWIVSHDAKADIVDECADASEIGQRLRDEGKLLSAEEQLVACTQPACPELIRNDCRTWLTSLRGRIPSLVPRARDEQGRDLVDVRVSMDGRVVAQQLDGRAVRVDPGAHVVRFETAEGMGREVEVVAHEGEKGKLVDVVFGERGAAEGGGGIPAGVWVFGSLGAAGVASFAVFGTRAKREVQDMRDTCAPVCSSDRVDEARRDAWIANGSLGVAVLALGAGAIWWISAGDGEVVKEQGKAGTAVWAVVPTRGGAAGSLQLRF